MKQLTAQNEKLRDTLVKMRDLTAHEKSENMRLAKDLEEKQHQVRRPLVIFQYQTVLISSQLLPTAALLWLFFLHSILLDLRKLTIT